MTHLAFIGGGNMARSLIGGLLKTGAANAADIAVAEPQASARDDLTRTLGVTCYAENQAAVANAEVVVLAVKPQIMPQLRAGLHEALQRTQPLLISIAAGVRIQQLERWFGALPIVRCMPNTPALIGAGATGLFANHQVSAEQKAQAQHILAAVGIAHWVDDEALMDTVTALSGSGPAYFFALVEALTNAAVAQGLPRDTARALAAQTCLGAGRMLVESGEDAAVLRQRVTSPHGTTQAALESFSADGLARIAANAVAAATARGIALSTELDQTP